MTIIGIITTLIVGGDNGDLDEKSIFSHFLPDLTSQNLWKENLSNKRELESWKWQKSSIMKVKVNVKVKSDK